MRSYKEGIAYQYLKETKYDRESIFRRDDLGPIPRPSVYKNYPNADRVTLPKPAFEETESLWRILDQRRSRRHYTAEPISIQTLANLLWATQGITLSASEYQFRTAPSAGALYPVETYLSIHYVSDIRPGIYHYNILDFALEEITQGNFADRLARAALDQAMVAGGAALFIWTAIVLRSMWKYRNRCIRYIFMDAGHIAQNLQLAATALNLGCCPIGAFYDEEINQLLRIDGEEETAIYLAAVGNLSS
ncbi:MAG: SagB/ThcOx family dehydrogenase [Deltaproteobacteria bacterium]|nr:SagB/ThcOx family dehydrogenase [Deltaproteobacteria bacterium]MBW2075254.1 SagB/ThcOx family dehydrogenase [Deltaproteobacteria bacterium]RLB81895.1 MAG: SagB/ThcOx family dehydrogenase [Deltaproteobacteria bacterium]